MRPHGIDYLGPLPHQKIARAMQHQPALLLGRFDLYETHGQPTRLTLNEHPPDLSSPGLLTKVDL